MSASYKVWLRGGLIEGEYKGSGLNMAMKGRIGNEKEERDGGVGDGDRQSEKYLEIQVWRQND